MRHLALSFVLAMSLMLISVAEAQISAGAGTQTFHARISVLYSFEPHTLSTEQMKAKSKMLDDFWTEVKADPKRYLPLLRNELRNTQNSAFFAYDGSKLLLDMSKERGDQALALETIPRADLRGIDHTNYLRTIHWFATNGFDTTKAAMRILDFPDFQAFIVQHALKLGQNYSLIYMLFPMPESTYVGSLINRLKTEDRVVSQHSLLLALWYTMTPEANTTLRQYMEDNSRPQETRNYAKQLSEQKAPITSVLTLSTAQQLREARQKAMYRLSDEALHEFDGLTAKMLAKQ